MNCSGIILNNPPDSRVVIGSGILDNKFTLTQKNPVGLVLLELQIIYYYYFISLVCWVVYYGGESY